MDDNGREIHVAVAGGCFLCRCVWWYVTVVIDAGVTVTVGMCGLVDDNGRELHVAVAGGIVCCVIASGGMLRSSSMLV